MFEKIYGIYLLDGHLIKFFFALFFLIYFSLKDISEKRIPNIALILMAITGVILNILEHEFLKESLITTLSVFIISYFLWELSLISAGDVKLLTLLPLFLPYDLKINPFLIFAYNLIIISFIYLIIIFFTRIIKKNKEEAKILLKKLKESLINSLKIKNLIIIASIALPILVFFYVIPLSYLIKTAILILFVIIIINLYEEKILNIKMLEMLYFLVLIISLFLLFYFSLYKEISFIKYFLKSFFIILTFRILLDIIPEFMKKEKKIEDLKVGDKLAEIPVKEKNKFKIVPFKVFDIRNLIRIRKTAIDNYDPFTGLNKENISKIKKFFKTNKIIKVKVFEDVAFVPFLLIAYLLTYFYLF